MRSLMVCLAVLLAAAVLQCDGKKKKKDECTFNGKTIKDEDTRRLEHPCVLATCTGGNVNVTTCQEYKKHKKDEKETNSKKSEEDKEAKKKNTFPYCCKKNH